MAPQSVWRVTESTRRRAKARRLAIPQAGRGHSNAEVGGSGRKSSPPRTQGLGATERWRARRVDRSEMEARRLAVACGRRRVRRLRLPLPRQCESPSSVVRRIFELTIRQSLHGGYLDIRKAPHFSTL